MIKLSRVTDSEPLAPGHGGGGAGTAWKKEGKAVFQGRARIYEVDADSDATLQDVTEPPPIE